MWQLLTAAVPSIIKGISHSKNRPKKSDYKANTEGMRKYVNFLRGKKGTNQVMDQAMRPALRSIGQAGSKAQREIGYSTSRSGLRGSGIEAAQRESARQKQTQQLQAVGEKATSAQMLADASTEDKVQATYGKIDAENKRAQDAYNAAKRQHKQQMNQIWAEGIGNVATAGIGMAQQASADKALARRAEAYTSTPDIKGLSYDRLKDRGFGDEDVLSFFKDKYNTKPKMDPAQMMAVTKMLTNMGMSEEDIKKYIEGG